ncbi:hypothetical protein ABL78_0738 [Leptomonas seymouri]|uniref:CHCH domain-containing protein n=1 Tax=Leptomonas seymouri TaxID=5684 RepID=A0A0N1PF38_LEPSE|nr:hypothetical protein ABL78_0738 [Leptomonas seymouri]|eukprot:KPI90093.1 hypothetical protein ABL78_0738 [Leptomonas seymouri]
MSTDTPIEPQESAYEADALPDEVEPAKAILHPLPDDALNDSSSDKYQRARNHISGIEHASANNAFKSYKRSWLTPFFGSNEAEPFFEEKKLNPCQAFSRDVHQCLEANNNSFALCQTRVAAFQHCLREFAM